MKKVVVVELEYNQVGSNARTDGNVYRMPPRTKLSIHCVSSAL